MTTSLTMFYGSPSTMSPTSKSRLKRQSRLLSHMISRTLSYKDRGSDSAFPSLGASDDPAELSIQLSAPGVLKVFGDNVCSGAHYKSVLATASSSAQELVKEALERYALNAVSASQYVLCDVVGRFGDLGQQWQAECLRVLQDNEKPLLIQDLWKPREGFSRRFELRKRSDVEELAAREVDTITAGINAQARKLQKSRAKGATTLTTACKRNSTPPTLRRTVSETSLSQTNTQEEEPKGHSTLLDPHQSPEDPSKELQASVEERNNSNNMRYSLYQSPHLLLLQGYSQQHDSLVYVLNREQHTVGQRTPSSKPSISLSAPDILPLHCTIRRLHLSSHSRSSQVEEKLILEPIPGASISINFSEVGKTMVLRHGDLLSLGLYYLLLYKDPARAHVLPAQTLARLKAVPRTSDPVTCKMCGTVLRGRAPSSYKKHRALPGQKTPRRRLHLEFEPAIEDVLVKRIMTLIEPGGDDHKLTPAFLLCLCIQHSATNFEPGEFGQLLLKLAKLIQRTVWEKTKELAEKQSQHQDPISLSRLTIADLLPDLQHILFWMSNSIELLYFVQQKSPLYIQSIEEELDVKGSKESLFSSTITASEEAMTILEEVIMYTFQQCVYYISKSLYISLPVLLECIPFQNESRESWCSAPQLPEELRRIVSIYQATLDLLQQYEVHPEIASQMFAYLFFFSNTLLFNQLLDKGPVLSCFHWPKGVQICARLQQLLEWAQSIGFGPLAEQFFKKLSCTVNLLATPSAQLIQMTWSSLRTQFPELNPAQLHRLLTRYQLASDIGSVTAWEPLDEDRPKAFRTEDVLESYDNHPPIVLPSGGFKVDLEVECLDDNIYRHLLYIRHFLWSLQSKSSHAKGPEPENLKGLHHTIPEGNPESRSSVVISRDVGDQLNSKHSVSSAGKTVGETAKTLSVPASGVSRTPSPGRTPALEKLKPQNSLGRNGPKMNIAQGDASCLLTPPNTPLNLEPRSQDSPQPSGSCEKACQELKKNGLSAQSTAQEGDSSTPFEYPTPASSSCSSATDDFCYAFVVELEKGPTGLGIGLVNGLHTPLHAPGIYIQNLVQDSPAASDGRLSLGDRILAVNGTNLIGTDYQSAVDLIRYAGKKLQFLVAKSDIEITKKIISSTSPS
ncbi:ras-associating and dilute domain-containing protein [Monodelphis domestica]|uniref:ras-associating and dilute domain-containing protein n=1 Tax=Monodelphis domestica TaxID=13616 RepID=UPI0024E246EF|nr:ras-associating and dilute domain-containing protein [Monodelphis domestica]XP_056662437.1 ras-associating and dilute domain-containing protein [Monodelphis domestica]XP_056662438.1 ras-associating and dilute domain-containing protein [Monodelphis domestica]XP_056662439.1 ras-associating and dilute domain-containing protein [Monodelphis domestica]